MSAPAREPVAAFLMALQDEICIALEEADGGAAFSREELVGERGGSARPRVLEGGAVIEKAAVNFSQPTGARLPPAATEARPDLAGASFEAASLSLIVHPRNPHAPTTHANFRGFFVGDAGNVRDWWFGGGYDLTPYYGDEDDCRHWHETARNACDKHGPDLYPRFKQWCDEYFYLPHRAEPRGIGGIFFDEYRGNDSNAGDFDTAFAFIKDAANSFLPAYLPILERRKDSPYDARERAFQRYRRGRYVEFNLVYDRGTRYGLEAGARVESVLASLPPEVTWRYDWHPKPGTPEARLYDEFLKPRAWA